MLGVKSKFKNSKNLQVMDDITPNFFFFVCFINELCALLVVYFSLLRVLIHLKEKYN